MPLLLDDQECAILRRALGYYLPQLRFERSRAEARDAQHDLATLEDALEAILLRLDQAASAALSASIPAGP
jgi:hypothetical protein